MKLSDKEQLARTIVQTRELLTRLENDEIETAQKLINALAT